MAKLSGQQKRDLCAAIMGAKLADAIIADMGIHWCIVAAMADPEGDRKPEIRAQLRAALAEEKEK